jgi:hypothetical protein
MGVASSMASCMTACLQQHLNVTCLLLCLQEYTRKKIADFLHSHTAYELIPESGKVGAGAARGMEAVQAYPSQGQAECRGVQISRLDSGMPLLVVGEQQEHGCRDSIE